MNARSSRGRLEEQEKSVQVHSISETVSFSSLGLNQALVRAVEHEGYKTPTSVQHEAIPHVLEGRDLFAGAQTGTGKTAAFLLPMLQRLSAPGQRGKIRALVLTPTRELASQIGERAQAYGRNLSVRHGVIYGGVGQRPQERLLERGIELLIATPGRLLDLIEQGFVHLDGVECFVLDEADRMLDMGFIHDVKRVVRELPSRRQTLMFSATMPKDVRSLASGLLEDPAQVAVTPTVTTAETVEQSLHFVAHSEKRKLLVSLLADSALARVLVFTRTKHGANRVSDFLERSGIVAAAIHGNKSQGARERALEGFRRGAVTVLVATDIAARGIDVEGISHVINFDLPNVAESYVHRIGRTGRAGASGRAISFCDPSERPLLSDIERFIRQRIPRVGGSDVAPTTDSSGTEATARPAARPPSRRGNWSRRSRGPRSFHSQSN